MPADATSQLWRVAVRASLGGGPWPDDAIDAAVALMRSGDGRPEVVEVAILASGTASRDARDVVMALLAAEGIPVLGPEPSDSDRRHLAAGAYASGGISAQEFASFWWGDLPAYDLQSEEQVQITSALDAWESEADMAAKASLADGLRAVVVRCLQQPTATF